MWYIARAMSVLAVGPVMVTIHPTRNPEVFSLYTALGTFYQSGHVSASSLFLLFLPHMTRLDLSLSFRKSFSEYNLLGMVPPFLWTI